jgi:hypothetical protein
MIRLKDLLQERIVYPLDVVQRVAQSMGESVTEELGRGANGVAYALESGRVLKITPDQAEVALATRLRTKRLFKHIVNVYDVRKMNTQYAQAEEYAPGDQHVIIMDYVEPFSDNHRRIWNEIRYTYMDMTVSDAEVLSRIPRLIQSDFKIVKDDAFIQRIMPQRKGLVRDFNELRIVWREAHGANMGWNRHGSLVHFDAWQHMHYTKIPAYMKDYAKGMGRPLGAEAPRNMVVTKRGLGPDINLENM